jgi:hypothetical protein
MTQHLRVSIGTADEMAQFMTAFKEIFPAKARSTAAGVSVVETSKLEGRS